jgi:hypothetical protein
MTDILLLTTSAAWRKLKQQCAETAQAEKSPQESAKFHAINYISLAPYSTEDASHHLAKVANENAFAACELSLYRASILFTYKHIIDKDIQRALEECHHAIAYLQQGLNRLGITTELTKSDTALRTRSFVNSLASQAELQQARIKHKIASHLVFVLGMHRSGTSAITGMLAQAGFAAPLDQMPANTVNPKGFWESLSIFELNEDFLGKMESHWISSLPLPEGWSESISAREWRTSLINVISETYAGAELPAIKDPRFCTLIPGLEPWLESRLIDTSFIIPIRNPLEVYKSLMKAHGTDLYKSLRLWIHSIQTAEKATRNHRRTFISFDSLIQDSSNALAACLKLVEPDPNLKNTLSMSSSDHKDRHEDISQAVAFIDKNLRRQWGEIIEQDLAKTGSHREARLIKLANETYNEILANMTDDERISRVLDKLEPKIHQVLAL